MADNISIAFKHGKQESPALYSHGNGMGFLDMVKEYIRELKRERMNDYEAGEPAVIMVDFIRWLTCREGRITMDYYLYKDGSNENANYDNGHWVYDLDTDEIKKAPEKWEKEE